MDGWMNIWVYKWFFRWMDALFDVCVSGCVSGRIVQWIVLCNTHAGNVPNFKIVDIGYTKQMY